MSFPPSIHKFIDQELPDLNPLIADGLATDHMQEVENYLDEVLHSNAQTFPPALRYVGCRRCTYLEWYNVLMKKQGKNPHETARSDVYLMEYKFEYEGREIIRHMFLPFISRGALIYLSGTRYGITPILTDRVISIGVTNVFVRLLKARITINRDSMFYFSNASADRLESQSVAWSDIYNTPTGQVTTGQVIKGKCTLVHYLFCKYGLKETFQRFANCPEVVVGGEEINEENYPIEDWVICRSREIAPHNKIKWAYVPTKLRIAIPREKYNCTEGPFAGQARNLVAGFYYVVDRFPQRMAAEDVNHTRPWMLLLGNLIWPGDVSYAKIYTDVIDHITSLDGYLDTLNKDKLALIGYPCETVYDLFATIIRNFNAWVLGPEDRVRTMYDKELQVLYFVCMGITSSISNLGFKLQAASKKPMNYDKVVRLMNQYFKRGLIWKINVDHGEVASQSTSGDNMALKITNQLVPQSASSRTRSKRTRVQLDDPTKRMHASIAEVGGYANLPKREPTGRSRLNPTVWVSQLGRVLRKPYYEKFLDDVQEEFARKT